MSRMSWRPEFGWLMYTGPEGNLSGEVYHLSLHTTVSRTEISSISSFNRYYAAGPVEVTRLS